MKKELHNILRASRRVLTLLALVILVNNSPLFAQNGGAGALKSLRSDVGIIGLTPNFKWLNSYSYMGSDTLAKDGSSELEFKIRDVRMMSEFVGVGFQIMTSIFTDGSRFGFGSWGIGPVVRGYPFRSSRLQPYFQGESLFGKNMAAGDLSDTRTGGKGFRMRLGLRAGLAYRINNDIGIFVDFGPDWESSSLFKADARTLQLNIGIDWYRFN